MSASPTFVSQPTVSEALLSDFFETSGAGTPEQLPDVKILEVSLQSDPDNSGSDPLWIGGPNVMSDGSGGGNQLDPGDSISVSMTNLNKIYVACDAIVRVNYLATTEFNQ